MACVPLYLPSRHGLQGPAPELFLYVPGEHAVHESSAFLYAPALQVKVEHWVVHPSSQLVSQPVSQLESQLESQLDMKNKSQLPSQLP